MLSAGDGAVLGVEEDGRWYRWHPAAAAPARNGYSVLDDADPALVQRLPRVRATWRAGAVYQQQVLVLAADLVSPGRNCGTAVPGVLAAPLD
jgi:hypothetical protein